MPKDFEEALKELEEIVKALESKDVKLNDAVLNYNKGLELSKYCYEELLKAEKLIVKNTEDDTLFKVSE